MTQPNRAEAQANRTVRRRMSADARRAQLLETARDVFLRSGFSGTTVREITDAADVDTALLYRHFESKEEIFDAAVAQPLERAISGLIAQAAEASAYIGRPEIQREQVTRVLTRLLDVMAEVTPLMGIVLFSERGATFYRDHLGSAIGTVAQAAKIAQPHAGHRAYDAEVVATMLVGACLANGMRELFEGPGAEHGTIARELTDLLFDGIVPR